MAPLFFRAASNRFQPVIQAKGLVQSPQIFIQSCRNLSSTLPQGRDDTLKEIFEWSMAFIIIILFLTSCASLHPTTEKRRTVAVWYIEDLSPKKALPDMAEILMIEIIETLKKRGIYDEVIERKRLDLIMEELHLGSQKIVDEETRLKVGRMVGARYMVFGSYQVHGKIMRIDLRLVEVETGAIRKGISKIPSRVDLAASIEAARKAAEEL